MRYNYVVWSFDSREIDQICNLVRQRYEGKYAVDRRRFTKNVLDYAERTNLVVKGKYITAPDWNAWKDEPGYPDCPVPFTHPDYVTDISRLYISVCLVNRWSWRNLPQEALWRLVEPIIQKRQGYSITYLRDWHVLDLGSEGDASILCSSLEIFQVLSDLDKWGYIRLQAAGSTWAITVTPERATRSESTDNCKGCDLLVPFFQLQGGLCPDCQKRAERLAA